ncbi:MAG: hypothetical protein V3R92_03130 [Dehalococcoidales bacterium]
MKKLLVTVSLVLLLGISIVGSALPALAHNAAEGGAIASSGVAVDQPTVVRLAEVLDLTPEELVSLLQAGETLSEIADAQNIDEEAVVTAILAPHTSQIALRVDYGYITREQADAMLAEAGEYAHSLLTRDLSVAGNYGNWEEMEEACIGMMGNYGGMTGNGWGGMMGGDMMGGGGMMDGGMMGGDWSGNEFQARTYGDAANSGGWNGMMGRFWNNITHWNWGGSGGGMMGGSW